MKYDIELLSERSNSNITGFDFKESGKLMSGRTKIVKRFIQLLFTLPGSDKTDPNAGCWLLDYVANINMDDNSINMVVEKAVSDCTAQIIATQPEDTPNTERVTTVSVYNIAMDLDHCDLTLNFKFGDDVSISTPVTLDIP